MEYLSPEWLAAAHEALGVVTPVDADVVVAYTVTGDGDDADVAYAVRLGPGRVGTSTDPGAVADADVSFALLRSSAEAIARGERSASSAFLDGELRLGGDINVLLEHARTLADVDDVLAGLRPGTGGEGG